MHDTIHLVQKGIPVVVVVTRMFVNEALEVGKKFGLSVPPMVVVDHPFATLGLRELQNLVEKTFDDIHRQLTGA